MRVAYAPSELERRDRAVAIGSFDGVHRGHARLIEAARAEGLATTVVTFHPHPRRVLGYQVELLSTLDRRLELLAELGVEETLIVEFTLDLQRVEPEEFAADILAPIGTRVVVAGEGFQFGHRRRGDLTLLEQLGYGVRRVPLLEGVSSSEIRDLLHCGEVAGAAAMLGRPVEVEGIVVEGDARGGTLGFPTANLDVDPELLVPGFGIYAGFTHGCRAAVSIGTNPHYGGHERRVEAFLLDFSGDLYGRRLVIELWRRMREERAFASERELIEQIMLDVEEARRAERPI